MLNSIIGDNLQIILESIILIEERFSKINAPEKFIISQDGLLLLDAVSMRLQVIGELTKKIHKIKPSLLKEYSEIDWDKIIKLREIISHHYEMVDHEIIFDICRNHIPILKSTIQKIIDKENSN
ncbi:MAG TPA: HepT-like ribonuclease domain-containing protein [Desulfatiglandales bacterium]|nr:HepT-like ribonuclease domain-containing protein [Desulfatiglandales bacterium]